MKQLQAFGRQRVRLGALPEIGEQAAAEIYHPGSLVTGHVRGMGIRIAEPGSIPGDKIFERQGIAHGAVLAQKDFVEFA